jgi:hypothetical protein
VQGYLSWAELEFPTPATTSVTLTGQSVTASRGGLSPPATVALGGLSTTVSRGTLGNSGATLAYLSWAELEFPTAMAHVLTGLSTTVARGLLHAPLGNTVGQSVTVSGGTLRPSSSFAISVVGADQMETQGSLTASRAATLTGAALTSAKGTLGFNGGTIIAVLTGLSASTARGIFGLSVTGPVTVSIAGLSTTCVAGTIPFALANSGMAALVGQALTLSQGVPLGRGPFDLYPTLPQIAGTAITPRFGVVERIGSNGAIGGRAQAPTKHDAVVIHMLDRNGRNSLLQFYNANRALPILFTAEEDSTQRKMVFGDKGYVLDPAGYGKYQATVYLLEA